MHYVPTAVNPVITAHYMIGRDLIIELSDCRTIRIPTDWYPRLRDATSTQLGNMQIIGPGIGIHWPELDEDLSIDKLVQERSA
jgi:Protein of unknown function (DUF2442)